MPARVSASRAGRSMRFMTRAIPSGRYGLMRRASGPDSLHARLLSLIVWQAIDRNDCQVLEVAAELLKRFQEVRIPAQGRESRLERLTGDPVQL